MNGGTAMNYPALKPLPRKRAHIGTFYGYEHLRQVRPGAFYDMCNLSSGHFPLLSTRPPRLRHKTFRRAGQALQPLDVVPDGTLTAAAAVNGTVALCTESKTYYYGHEVPDAAPEADAPWRSIIPFGRNFFIAPDGKYVLTDENGACGVRHAAFRQALLDAGVSYVLADGTAVWPLNPSETEPLDPSGGWTDVSGGGMVQKIYADGTWQTVGDLYVRLSHAKAGHYAVPGDKVKLRVGSFPETDGTVFAAGEGYVDISTAGVQAVPTTYVVSLKKTMPVLDVAVEHGNRVWGARFGKNQNGDFVNEIYASALGDPTVWDRLEGVSTDSYTASLGCPGVFTGAAVTGGELIFFKEDYVIRVSGLTPQDFTVSVTPARGVRAGHTAACVTLNEKVFYLSAAGVTVYDGALPYCISPEFRTHGFTDTLACAHGGKYYLAAAENGVRRIYVYDTVTGLWHVEDDKQNVRFFVPADGALFVLCRPDPAGAEYRFYATDAGEAGEARPMLGPPDEDLVCTFEPEAPLEWYARTGQLTAGDGTFILRQLIFNVALEEDAEFRAAICCDGGREVPLCRVVRRGEGAFSVPVNTPRCSRFSLVLSGTGGCTVHGIGIVTEKTGEVTGLVR